MAGRAPLGRGGAKGGLTAHARARARMHAHAALPHRQCASQRLYQTMLYGQWPGWTLDRGSWTGAHFASAAHVDISHPRRQSGKTNAALLDPALGRSPSFPTAHTRRTLVALQRLGPIRHMPPFSRATLSPPAPIGWHRGIYCGMIDCPNPIFLKSFHALASKVFPLSSRLFAPWSTSALSFLS